MIPYLAACAVVGGLAAVVVGTPVAYLFAGLVGICLEAVIYGAE